MSSDFWRPFLAKIIAPFVGFAATWLKHKYNIDFGVDEQNQVVLQLTDLLVFAITTGLAAVAINKKANPGNAASAHLAAREKHEAVVLKGKTE